jgi:hypothetical protein
MLLYRESQEAVEDLVKHHRLINLMNIFLTNTIIIFILGALTYGEKFQFWDYAYSYLGMIKTPGGNENTLSFIIYVAGCMINSVICFKVSNNITGHLNKIFFKTCGAGYLLLMLPCDVINSIHSIGGALAVGSLWFFSIISINDIYHSGNKFRAVLYFLLLNGTILPYAFAHFMDLSWKQIAQKPALLGLIIVLKLILAEHSDNKIKEHKQVF